MNLEQFKSSAQMRFYGQVNLYGDYVIKWEWRDINSIEQRQIYIWNDREFETQESAIRAIWQEEARDRFLRHKCDECHENTPMQFVRINGTQSWVCQDCLDADYVQHRNGEYIHHEDAFTCDSCGEVNHIDESHTTVHDDIIGDCCIYNYRWCVDVEAYAHYEYAYYSESTDEWYHHPDNRPHQNLHDYSADVLCELGRQMYVKGKPQRLGRNLVFGVELECDSRGSYDQEDIAELLLSAGFGDVGICKTDSTVSGIEAVTLPADLESHKGFDWDGWCRTLRTCAKGHYAKDAGMHIHINRAALSQLVLGKILVFMNDPKNAEFLSLIAQRDVVDAEWCSQSTMEKLKKIGSAGRDPESGKYSIMNTTHNTVECRMFRATLLPERIYKNIEFCDALVNWCRKTSNKQVAGTVNGVAPATSFVAYVLKNRKDYPHLKEFITSRLEA